MEKLGLRGTATARLAFDNMPVPSENILGPLGGGLKVALSVLDFGRTTFGACTTGTAKACLRLAVRHAATRRQFNRTLGEFELVKKKIARMAAYTYAMDAMTYVTASLIDRGLEDYMLETAMLKVYSTDALWMIINDAFQIHGGAAYFTDLPLERMLRDARVNQIAEGANEVLFSFVALVGMRAPGEQLRDVWDAMHHPWGELNVLRRFASEQASVRMRNPHVPVKHPGLKGYASELSGLIRQFGVSVQRTLRRYREEVLDRQFQQERIARAAMELFASACVLSRLDARQSGLLPGVDQPGLGSEAAELFLKSSARRVRWALAELADNDDDLTTAVADQALRDSRRLPR